MAGLDTAVVGQASMPLMRMVSNQEIERQAAEVTQNKPEIVGLAKYLHKQWDSAKRTKETIERQLMQDLRQRNGDYDPDKLVQIRKQGGSEIYMMLTAAKCRAAEAWLKDIFNGEEEPWDLETTPLPDLPEEVAAQIQENVYQEALQEAMAISAVDGIITPAEMMMIRQSLVSRMAEMADLEIDKMQELAEEKAKRMKQKIRDQLTEGGFCGAMDEVLSDIVTFKAGFLKGPIIRKTKKLEWGEGWQPIESEGYAIKFERRSPFDIYPLSDTTDIYQGGFFDRQPMSVGGLNAMIGVEGYDDAAIRAVIDEFGKGGLKEWLAHDFERAEQEDRPYDYQNDSRTIEALEFWGAVPGVVLLDEGFPEEVITDRHAEYEINAWMIDRWVVKAGINKSPLGRRPYGKASYENVPGSFWGRGVPELMRDIQQVCNATARALVNNLAVASGPQVAINDINRIPKGEDVSDIYPWKIWQFTPDIQSNGQKPVDFYQPDIMTTQLIEVFDYFSKLSDDYTGIPAYIQGQTTVTGAGRTASGLSMLMTHATRGIKSVISNIDFGIINPVIESVYIHNMLFDPDENIKGDLQIKPLGTKNLFTKEQAQVRRNEFLLTTNNPADLEIMGMEGRAAILREVSKSLNMRPEKIVPSEDVIRNKVLQQQQMVQQQTLDEAGNPVSGQDTALF